MFINDSSFECKLICTVIDELYREMDLFVNAPKERLQWTSIAESARTQSHENDVFRNIKNFASVFQLFADA